MKNIPKNLPSGLIKKAFTHLQNAEQSLSLGLFSSEDFEKVEKIDRKFEAIKKNN